MMNHQDVIVAKETEEETINKVKLVGSVVHKFRPRDNVMVLTVAAGRAGTDHAPHYERTDPVLSEHCRSYVEQGAHKP